MKPFNFEEFKAGKPAKLRNTIYHFIGYDENLHNPLVVRYGKFLDKFTLEYFESEATMLPTKREVWIAIIKTDKGKIEPIGSFYSTKEAALEIFGRSFQVTDAIPYTIEE